MELKKIRFKPINLIILFILSILIILIVSLYNNLDLLLLLTTLFSGLNLFFAYRNLKTHLVYFLFNITLFTFMLSKIFIDIIITGEWLAYYSYDVKKHTIIIILVSILSLSIGAYLYKKIYRIKIKSNSTIIKENSNIVDIKAISIYSTVALILFYASYIPNLVQVIDIARNVISESYLSYYTTYTSNIPLALRKIGDMNIVALVILFVTKTPKRKIKLPLILFMISSSVSLLGGQRNIFVLNLIMIIYGYVYREMKVKYTNEEKWISLKHKLASVVLIPLLIIILTVVGSLRYNQQFNIDAKNAFLSFANSQGGQVEFIALSIENNDKIWEQQVPYSFGTIYEYFTQNKIAYSLFEIPYIKPYTTEYALKGNSLASTLYYIISPQSLLAGKGMGNSYMAELFYDFGYYGIVIANIILGYILMSISNFMIIRTWWRDAFIFFIVRWIVYIPRASLLTWIVNTFSLTNITTIFIITICGNFLGRDNNL